MRIFIFTTFLTGISFYSSAQNYIDYLNVANEAEHEFIDGNLDSARKIFSSLENKYHKLKGKDYFYIGLIHYFQNDTIKGKKYLIKCAEERLLLTEDLKKFKKKFPELNISENTIDQLKLIEKKEIPLIEYQVSDTIKELMRLDQEDRVALGKEDEKKDLVVQKRLLNFLQRNGMPNPYIQGEEIITIILHVGDTSLYRLYTSFLYQQIIKGKASPMYYCILVDRTGFRNHHQTLYNTYNPGKETMDVNKEQIIENRKKIGLSQYYLGTGNFPKIRNK